jgi:hypothetical protein
MSKKRKNLKDEVEPLDYGGSCSVLFPLRSHIRRPSAGTALSMVDGKTHKIPEKKTTSQPNSNLQELTLIEQLEEIKKDYQVNFNKEVANLRQEKKQIQLELDILYKKLPENREYVRQVLQKQEVLQKLEEKLVFLLSGQCKKLLLQRFNEFNQYHRLDPVALTEEKKKTHLPPPAPSKAKPNPTNSSAQKGNDEVLLMKKLGFESDAKEDRRQTCRKRKKMFLSESDPFFSHLNCTPDAPLLTASTDTKSIKSPIVKQSVSPVAESVFPAKIPAEYDIANILYLTKNHAACIQAAATQPSVESCDNNLIQQNGSNTRYRLFCNCGLPMLDKYDVGKVFCIQCGLSKEFQDMLPTYSEENSVRPATVHTKKNSQISAVLNPFRPIPFVSLPERPFDCLRKDRQIQIIKTRKPINDEQVKNILQKNGLAKPFYPYRNQITTHFTGLPPSQYLTPQKDSYWTSTLQKNPSLIAKYRMYCKRPMLEKFQSGGNTLNLIDYLEKMHPPAPSAMEGHEILHEDGSEGAEPSEALDVPDDEEENETDNEEEGENV